MGYKTPKNWNRIKNLLGIETIEDSDNDNKDVKIIFNMPKKEFKEMVEEEIIPLKTFYVRLSKEEVLKLMEEEEEYELNYDTDINVEEFIKKY